MSTLVRIASHVGTVVGFVLAVVLMARVLRERRPPTSTLAWLLAIGLVPYVGVPLYFLFGGRKRRLRHEKPSLRTAHPLASRVREDASSPAAQALLVAAGAPPARTGHELAFLADGEAAYRALVDLIDGAEVSLDVATFILGGDAVGATITDHLARAAARGVRVRLLLDALFSFRTRRRDLEKITRAGGRVVWFMPLWRLRIRGRAHLRNHRKLVIADDVRALVGGMNIAEEYLGATPLRDRWRDVMMRLEGPSVADLASIFAADWVYATGDAEGASAELPPDVEPSEPHGGAIVQVVASGPDVRRDSLYEALLYSIFSAKRRVHIVTPYFVPDDSLLRGLVLAARRGVDVRVVVPDRSNHGMVDLAGAADLREVEAAGGVVLRFLPRMIHAKVFVVDDVAVVGSANFDVRSFFLDYEVAAFVYSAREVKTIASFIESLRDECVVGTRPSGFLRRLAEDVARLLAPLL